MRSKAPLAMMEQAVMVLVFALAAAICLRAFVWADSKSAWNADRDQAILRAESAAETLKRYRGDLEQTAAALGLEGQQSGGSWTVSYGEDWTETADEPKYILNIETTDSGDPLLGSAQVDVTDAGGELLFSLPVAWQEVTAHG